MPQHHIEQLLQQRMGLHSATVGSSTIVRAVEQRMRACNIETVNEYRDIVTRSDTELDALIEAVVIPETWFFRDPTAFRALSDWLRNEWIPNRPGAAVLRILSVPCSSGEEPYTLAMCLAECGIGANEARIDAVDISSINLEKARQARYGRNSFRGDNILYRDRYFDHQAPYYHLSNAVRQRVNFQRGNILESDFTGDRSPYHVIFCRNLLIYFDRPTQHRAIDQLEQLLTENGLLFLGHSETSLLQQRCFAPLPFERCFGFRREPAVARTPAAPCTPPRPARGHRPVKKRAPVPAPFSAVTTGAAPAKAAFSAADREALLTRAFQLADQGHMDEAAACCESLLRVNVYQAHAYYLLGVIREAAGNTREAEQMFRKAVYLQPDYYQALVHLSVICERTGDTGGARRFLERATRAESRQQQSGTAK
jgi:chemotaxis protein methyltransferase WspC